MYVLYFVFLKFCFVKLARLSEISLSCRMGGRLITLWEPFSWDNTVPEAVSRVGSHGRTLLLALTLKESVTLTVAPRKGTWSSYHRGRPGASGKMPGTLPAFGDERASHTSGEMGREAAGKFRRGQGTGSSV